MNRRRLTCLWLIVLALVVGGCSSDDDDGGSARDREAESDAVDERAFQDPEGKYEMEIALGWRELPGSFVAEVEAWAVGPRDDGFVPNVNVLVQEFPGDDPEDYIDFSDGGGAIDLSDAEVIELDDGVRAARFEYEQTQGGLKLRSLGIAVTSEGEAVLATLTTLAPDFDHYVESVEPLLRTLRAVDT